MPVSGDTVYVSRGSSLDIDIDLALLLIVLGHESGGASPANNRYGILKQRAGKKITFDGAASIAGSGIKCNPTSADASSKNNKIWIPGTVDNPAVWDVATQWDINKRWQCKMDWGFPDVENLDILANTSYTSGINQIMIRPHTDYAPAGAVFKLNRVCFPHIYGIGVRVNGNISGRRNLDLQVKRCEMNCFSNWYHTFLYDGCFTSTGNAGIIDFGDFHWTHPGAGYSKVLFTSLSQADLYIVNNKISYEDIRGRDGEVVIRSPLSPGRL